MFQLSCVCAVLLFVSSSQAADDRTALGGIFDEQHVDTGQFELHRRLSGLDAEQRFRWLSEWVLPGRSHVAFRFSGGFAPGSAAAVLMPPEARSLDSLVFSAGNPGSLVLSPALELIAAARQTNRLGELRERIAACDATDGLQKYRKDALLFLVSAAAGDDAAAIEAFDRIIRQNDLPDTREWEFRWPAFLMLCSTRGRPQLLGHVSEYFFSRFADMTHYRSDPGIDVLNDHLRAISSTLQRRDGDAAANEVVIGEFGTDEANQWLPFHYSDSSTHGLGRPQPRWQMRPGKVTKLFGHESDFLTFQSPLRGDFEIECDMTVQAGQHLSMLLSGSHFEPMPDGTSLRMHNFRKPPRSVPLTVPLTKLGEFARYRAVSKDGTLTEFINGSVVQSRKLTPEHDPWLAIRTWRRSHGQVRDLRITGNPTIPDSVLLSVTPDLDNWAPYFEEGFGASGNWSGVADASGTIEIRGRRRPELHGMAVEKLLRFARPLFEDGTLDFEFFYQAGVANVSPALDRLAFVLEPSGVRLHQITDRQYEFSPLDPAALLDVPAGRRGPDTLPLIDHDWNRLTLTLNGNDVALQLNGQLVFEHSLQPERPRTFGLFHFSDQTEVRVRDVVWRGDWPKLLLPVEHQILASRELDDLEERVAKLPAVLHHDFRNGVPEDLFDVAADMRPIRQSGSGVRAERINIGSFGQLLTCVQLHGDFDIVARFSDLEIEMPEPRWQAGIGLRVLFDSPLSNRTSVFRLLARSAEHRRVAFYQSSDLPDGTRRVSGGYQVEESLSGRLRLCRLGTKLYGMFAESDSPNFRLIREIDTVAEPTALQGICLALESAATTTVRAEWNELLIRAERISGQPVENQADVVRQLEQRRKSFTTSVLDFSDESVRNQTMIDVDGDTEITGDSNGFRIRASSSGKRASGSLGRELVAADQFDIETVLRIDRLDQPTVPTNYSEVVMQVFLRDAGAMSVVSPHELSLLLRQYGDGQRELVARQVRRDAQRQRTFHPIRTLTVKHPDRLRIAQSDGRLWFLYSETDSDDWCVIAEVEVGPNLQSNSVVLAASAIDASRIADATFRSIRVSYPRPVE